MRKWRPCLTPAQAAERKARIAAEGGPRLSRNGTPQHGAPAWDDPRRCQSKRHHRQWAAKGSRFCKRCEPNRAARGKVYLDRLPVFYSRNLRETLAQAVEDQLGLHPDEQCALYEELAVTRVMAGDALSLWDAARSLPDSNAKRGEILSVAESVARGALAEVRAMCEAAARVRSSSKGQVSVHNLQHIVAQMVKICYRVFGDDQERAREFEGLVRDELRVLADDQPGTSIPPGGDAEVMLLDSTVPAA